MLTKPTTVCQGLHTLNCTQDYTNQTPHSLSRPVHVKLQFLLSETHCFPIRSQNIACSPRKTDSLTSHSEYIHHTLNMYITLRIYITRWICTRNTTLWIYITLWICTPHSEYTHHTLNIYITLWIYKSRSEYILHTLNMYSRPHSDTLNIYITVEASHCGTLPPKMP